jgi:hypothetical protein
MTDRRPCYGIPNSRSLSVLGVSHAPDGLLRLPARGFVSPHCHVQGLPFREFPSRTAEPLRQRLVPSRRWAAPRCLGCPKRHTSSPRPQGFHPCESPWLRRRGLAVAEARFPRGLLLLQVLRPDVALMPSHQLPLVTLMRARRCRSRTGLQRSLPPSPTSSPEAADLLEVLCLPPIAFFRPRCSARPPLTSQQLNRAANRFRKLLLARAVPTRKRSRKRSHRVVPAL